MNKIDYRNATNEELTKEYRRISNLCDESDMSSDCGSLGSGRDSELFSYEWDLIWEMNRRHLLPLKD